MYYRAWWRRMMYKKESINITRVSMCCCCCCAHRPINQYPPRVGLSSTSVAAQPHNSIDLSHSKNGFNTQWWDGCNSGANCSIDCSYTALILF
jgi:hypothetical protein